MKRIFCIGLVIAASALYAEDPFIKIKGSYGPEIKADQCGRPVKVQVPNFPQESTAGIRIKQDTYGPGIHSDQCGRPVKITPVKPFK